MLNIKFRKGTAFFSVSHRSFGAKTSLKMEMTLNDTGRRKFEHVETELVSHEYLIFVGVLSDSGHWYRSDKDF